MKRYDTTAAHPHGFMEDVTRKGKPENVRASASLHTTAPDFGRFIMAIMNHQGLLKTTIDSMLTPQSSAAPQESNSVAWGLGIGLQQTPDDISYWHWGDNGNFKCFMVAFPDSWNVYDSLGEAYMEDGQKDPAIQNYEKSLELNPENTNGAETLEKLRRNLHDG